MNYEPMAEINDDGTLTIIPPRPGLLAAAVAAVMKEVRRLEKADNNAFAKYRFTSVDDYKDNLRPLLAANDLEPCLSQHHFERFIIPGEKPNDKDKTHCEFHFHLWLKHASGEVGEREGSVVCLPYTGAQTTGQARSYAQKEWLKSKFLASSGDLAEDADAYTLDIKLSKAEARKIYERLVSELREFGKEGTPEDLTKWADTNSILLDAMPNDWSIDLRNEYKQANLLIKDRQVAGPQIKIPTNVENWLSNLDAALRDCSSAEELSSAWSEAQTVASALPAEESRRAFAMLEKNQQRFAE